MTSSIQNRVCFFTYVLVILSLLDKNHCNFILTLNFNYAYIIEFDVTSVINIELRERVVRKLQKI